MAEIITYTCGRKSYLLYLGQWTVAFVVFTVFGKFFILDEFGDVHPYGPILLSIWIIGWLAVLLLGSMERYLYRLTIDFQPGRESRIVERSVFKRSSTFDSTAQFFVINAVGRSQFIRSSDEWEFGSLLSNEQRLGIVEKLNPRSLQAS